MQSGIAFCVGLGYMRFNYGYVPHYITSVLYYGICFVDALCQSSNNGRVISSVTEDIKIGMVAYVGNWYIVNWYDWYVSSPFNFFCFEFCHLSRYACTCHLTVQPRNFVRWIRRVLVNQQNWKQNCDTSLESLGNI